MAWKFNPFTGKLDYFEAGGSTNWGDIGGTLSDQTDLQDALDLKSDKTNVLELDNTTAFTPDADYEPATKKYVDDNAGGGGGSAAGSDTQVQFNDNGDFGGDSAFTFDKANENFVAGKLDVRNSLGRMYYDGAEWFRDGAGGFTLGNSSATLIQLQALGVFVQFRNGNMGLNKSNPSALFQAESLSASKVLFDLQAAAGQTAALMNLKDSAGTTLAKIDSTGKVQASGYKSADDSEGVTTTFINGDGDTVTVKNGLITNIS